MKAYVVGAGIFGCLAARALSSKGYDVTIFDCNKSGAGSKPAACLMKPSWMSSLDYKPALKFLGKHMEVHTLPFKVGILSVDCLWVDPRELMSTETFRVRNDPVISVEDGVVNTESKSYSGLVVVAAGVWSFQLFNESISLPEMRILCGSAILGTGRVKATINAYAPYRQAVWFNRGKDETWFGDGTAIIKKNFDNTHVAKTRERALSMAKIEGEAVSGQRPYIKGSSPGFFQRIYPNTFISTGGAKNGTILGAIQALKLLDSL